MTGAGIPEADPAAAPADDDDPPVPLVALAVQVVPLEGSVVLKRGVTSIRIDGAGAADAVTTVLEQARQPVTRERLLEAFAPGDHEAVDALLDHLLDRRILTAAAADAAGGADGVDGDGGIDGDALDVFYWNFGARRAVVAARLAAARFTVLGVNRVSRALVAALEAGSAGNGGTVEVVDYQLLRNVALFDEGGALRPEAWVAAARPPQPYPHWAEELADDEPRVVIATSDFGATPAIRQWNRYCVDHGWGFFPVVLQDLVGQIGPIVVPGETPCYECVRARQNSHMADPLAQRAPETRGFEEQRLAGVHPALAEVTGDLAALELIKFHARLPLWRAGSMVEVNPMAPSIAVRKVLKVPRCAVCSPTQVRSTATLDTRVYNLGYDER